MPVTWGVAPSSHWAHLSADVLGDVTSAVALVGALEDLPLCRCLCGHLVAEVPLVKSWTQEEKVERNQKKPLLYCTPTSTKTGQEKVEAVSPCFTIRDKLAKIWKKSGIGEGILILTYPHYRHEECRWLVATNLHVPGHPADVCHTLQAPAAQQARLEGHHLLSPGSKGPAVDFQPWYPNHCKGAKGMQPSTQGACNHVFKASKPATLCEATSEFNLSKASPKEVLSIKSTPNMAQWWTAKTDSTSVATNFRGLVCWCEKVWDLVILARRLSANMDLLTPNSLDHLRKPSVWNKAFGEFMNVNV